MNSWFFNVITLYMIFANFLKMAILIMAIFSKKFENHIYGELVKIWECTLVIIFLIFPQKWQFRLENESFENSWNSPYCIGYNILYWSNTDILQIQSSSWCMRQKSFLIEFIHILRIGPIRLNGIFVGIIHTVDTIYTVD